MNFNKMTKRELIQLLTELYCAEKKQYISKASDVVALLRTHIIKPKQEQFIVAVLNSANQIIHTEVVFLGTLDRALVHPREIFKLAIEHSGVSIIIAHNHPSNNPNPSNDDIVMTRKIEDASKIMSIPLLDHIIITETEFYSFRERNKLTCRN